MVYHALAEALAGPVPGVERLLQEAVKTGAQVLGSAACQKAALRLVGRPVAGQESLRECYSRLLAQSGRQPAALYESLHRHGYLAGQITWEVEQRYRALGLAPVDGELPDHASVELGFLEHLAFAEAEAETADDSHLSTRLRAEQRAFLRDHAGVWLPEVGAALTTAGDLFYATVGRLLSGFLAEELNGRQKRGSQPGARLPFLQEPAACTLCGLCVGSCPLGALRVIESATETALTLDPSQCVGCARCARICPEEVLHLSAGTPTVRATDCQVLRQSRRATCPDCGQPTVSRTELEAVFARLHADPVMQRRLSLCTECKSWSE